MKTVKAIFKDVILVGGWDECNELSYKIYPIFNTNSRSSSPYYIDELVIADEIETYDNEEYSYGLSGLQEVIQKIKERVVEYGSRDACSCIMFDNEPRAMIMHFKGDDNHDYYNVMLSKDNTLYYNINIKYPAPPMEVKCMKNNQEYNDLVATVVETNTLQFV